DARMQREITDNRLEDRHNACHRACAFRKDERVITLIEKRSRVTKRLSQRTGAFHRHEVGKVLDYRALVLRVEEIVSRREREHILSKLTKRHFRQAHVEVRTMICSDDEVGVWRNV